MPGGTDGARAPIVPNPNAVHSPRWSAQELSTARRNSRGHPHPPNRRNTAIPPRHAGRSKRSHTTRITTGRVLAERASRCCKRVLTDGCHSFSVVTVKPSESFWDAWERIRTSADPDPLEVLQVAAAFSRYFDAAQKEAISFARSAGLSWEQIAESLGQSRQALWQRASRDASLQALLAASGKRRWEAVKRDPISWYGGTKAFPA